MLSLKTALLPLLGVLGIHLLFGSLPPLTPEAETDGRRRQACTALQAAVDECMGIDNAIRQCEIAASWEELTDADGMFGGKGWRQTAWLERLTSISERVRSLGHGNAEGYSAGWWELEIEVRAGQ